MSIVVQKYGGSSVADVSRIKQVADRVMRTRREGHDVVVVVSAMGDTTDDLLGLVKEVLPNLDRRELDMLLTAGERISMALLSMAICELGGDSVSFTGSQSGIITNDRHADARIIEVRPVRVQDELARGKIVVIAGYQGVSYKRDVTTLGRGGSDTTAVAMAAAVGAEYCEVCSDVGGASEKDILLFEVEREGFSRAVLDILDEHHVAGKQLNISGNRLTLVVSRENLHEEARVREALQKTFGAAVRIADTLGALSVVGAGINASFDNVRR